VARRRDAWRAYAAGSEREAGRLPRDAAVQGVSTRIVSP